MRHFVLVAAILATATVAASAQDSIPRIIRGSIVSVDGMNVAVHAKSGESITLHLKADQSIIAVVPAALDDIKAGAYVGVAAMPGSDGVLKAMEVHIFPESQRGSGEGFRPFDLAPGSSMTNGAISTKVEAVDGPLLTVAYKGGEQEIKIDPATPVVTFAPGAPADLKPGADIDIFRPTATGERTYEAARIAVGRNGTKVPM